MVYALFLTIFVQFFGNVLPSLSKNIYEILTLTPETQKDLGSRQSKTKSKQFFGKKMI
jgi:hypothetical protein